MDNNQQQAFRDLLERYQQGQSSSGEEQLIGEWYDQLEVGEADFLDRYTAFTVAAERRLRSNLSGLPPAAGKTISLRRLLRWSAAAAFLGLLGYGVFFLFHQPAGSAKTLYTSISTAHNQIKTVTLPDGSRVWLNRLSRIEWAGNFGDSARTILLTGEARFDVAKNAGKPFLVQAGGTTTQVLGTVFNVEAYAEEQELKVSLLKGSVRFSAAGSGTLPVILEPGTMTRYRQADSTWSVVQIDNEVDAWTSGATVFNELPLTDAITRIARQQRWKLAWKNKKPLKGTVSAIFRRETAAQMLAGIAFSHPFHFTIEQDTLIIY